MASVQSTHSYSLWLRKLGGGTSSEELCPLYGFCLERKWKWCGMMEDVESNTIVWLPLQADVEHMQVSAGVRARLFAAMPLLLPQHGAMISAASPQVPSGALALLQGSISNTLSSSQKGNLPLETSLAKAKGVSTVVVDPELEVDAWTALEDGVGAVSGPIGGGEVGNLKANALLKGAVRVRRSPLTYVGAVDDDS
jgi:hypothetical protein